MEQFKGIHRFLGIFTVLGAVMILAELCEIDAKKTGQRRSPGCSWGIDPGKCGRTGGSSRDDPLSRYRAKGNT